MKKGLSSFLSLYLLLGIMVFILPSNFLYAQDDTVEEILGGLRSACTYAGARSIKDLPKCTTFVRVNRQLNEVFS